MTYLRPLIAFPYDLLITKLEAYCFDYYLDNRKQCAQINNKRIILQNNVLSILSPIVGSTLFNLLLTILCFLF